MKYYLPVIFLLISCSNSEKVPADLQYELGILNGNRIHVKIIYKPVEKGSTLFTYGEPRFGGQTDIMRGLTQLKVSDGAKLRINEASREIAVFYRDTVPLTIEYDITDTRTKEHGLRGELFRPVILNDYIYIHGINLFLNPVFRNSKQRVTQSVIWKIPPPFRLFQSFNPGSRETGISRGNPDDFMYRIITGAADMDIEKVETDGNSNYLVMRLIKNKEYNKKAVIEYFRMYYTGITQFWKETATQPYCLVIQPFLTVDHSMGGMSLGNGFVGKYSINADTILTPDRIFVLSHEIGHHWIGGMIDTDINDQWFGEGFNDYLTFYTLLMTGLMTPDQFEERFNGILESHYSSSVRNLPNDSIWTNYWKMGDYNKLPYRRGCIFAFYLDNQIRKRTGGQKSIHDLMLSLKEFCKNKGQGYQMNANDFIEVASEYVTKDTIQSEINRYIIKGDPIPFSDGMLLNAISVTFHNDVPVIHINGTNFFDH